MKQKVFIEKCLQYDSEAIYKIISKGVEQTVGIGHLKSIGRKVLLKPNILTAASPDEAVTTHPVFFEATVRYFTENGFIVSAGDSPAIEKLGFCLRKNGYREIMSRYGVKTADFDNVISMDNPGGLLVKRFDVTKAVTDADFIVNLPKLKTHSMLYHTGAMKNLFGTVKGLSKSKFHVRFPERENFAQMITDINLLVKPELSILDGVVSMHGHGPRNGRPFNTGFVIISHDPLAVDYVSAHLIGYDPLTLPVIRCAVGRKEKSWISGEGDIVFTDNTMENFVVSGFEKIEILSDTGFVKKIMPQFLYDFIRSFIVPKPVIIYSKCLSCRKCEEICGPKAISFLQDEKRIKIDYSACISCYCCHEICPHNSITLKKVFRNLRHKKA